MSDREGPADGGGTIGDVPFTDAVGHLIECRPVDAVCSEADLDALVAMYLDFDPRFRADGVPPRSESGIRRWLARLLDGHSIVAWDGSRAVGQVTLLPDEWYGQELSVFVHQDYQHGGVGARLVETSLAAAGEAGIERVGLLTSGTNRPMLELALGHGFVVTDAASGQVELGLDLAAHGSS